MCAPAAAPENANDPFGVRARENPHISHGSTGASERLYSGLYAAQVKQSIGPWSYKQVAEKPVSRQAAQRGLARIIHERSVNNPG
jgi:hypothetical protein